MKAQLQIKVSFEQILTLIRQLSKKEKIELVQHLEQEVIELKLSNFLKNFHTDELSPETIEQEVEMTRMKMYEGRSR